ncbi:MAG: choice-of-anchor Q domain-containing protein [Isosphaerales bacterium]
MEGGQVQLDAAATNPDGTSASSYAWTINGPNGFSQTLTGAEPMLTLGDPGTYSVKLSAGSGLTESSTIVAANVPPTISSLGTLLAYAAGVQQTITPVIVDPGPSDQNGGLKYVWSLTQNGQSYVPAGVNLAGSSLVFTPPLPSSTYGSPDIYKVYLTATDTSGATATASGTFAAIDPANDTVTTAKDTLDVTQGTSLREAIDVQYTSTQSGFFAIKFAPSLAYQTITLSTIDDTTDHGNSAIKIASHEKIDLDATSVPGITITALQPALGPLTRLFYLAPSAALRIQGLTLAGGIAYGNQDQATGGAIYVDSSAFLFLENSTLINNQAIGALTNTATGPGHAGPVAGTDGRGGAIFVNTTGSLFAANDTFTNNVATGATSAQINYSYGTVTYYGGSAYGGAIDDYGGGIILANDTIAANSVVSGSGPYPGVTPQGAGDFETNSAASFMYNSILSSNSGAPDYQAASLGSATGGHNIISNPGPGTPSGYIYSTANPLLGPLADHGHGVMTYSLLPGSPALSTGDPTSTFTEQFDGRGLPRVDSSGNVDIGAFEQQSYTVTNTNDSGPGSLRAAIAVDDDSSPIYFAANLAGQTILLTSGPIELSHSITLTGPGANQLEIQSAAGAAATLTPADLYKGEGNAADSAGGASGTIQGGVTFAAGRLGQAFQFNGTNSYIAVPPTADVIGTGAFTVSAWIKTGSDGLIIQQRDASNFNGEYVLSVSGGKIYWWDFGNSQYGFNMYSTKTVADNNWHDIVAVRQANGTGQIYIDGQLDSSQPGAAVPIGSNVNVSIGADLRDVYYGYPPYYFNGLIDEVAIYHRALSASDVQTGYIVGPSQLIISGGKASEIFKIDSGTVTLSGLTLANGPAPQGGAISSAGSLLINNDVFSNDVAQGTASNANAQGGAIFNAPGGVLTASGSTFNNDSALAATGGAAAGGAIENLGGVMTLTNDTFTLCLAQGGASGSGGAIDNASTFNIDSSVNKAGSASIVNVTISANTVLSGAGESPAPATSGAGLENDAGANLTLYNTIVANDVGGPDVVNLGTVTGGNNMVPTSTGLAAGVVTITDNPLLGPLQNNGGLTPTLAPAGQSAALDNGDNLFAPTIDQNGSPRIIGGQVDIGAVEYSGPIYVLNTNDSGGDSLRSALETAALYPNSTVVFDPSLAGQTITLSSEVLLQHDVVIDASATPGVIISGGNTNRVFEVNAGVTVTLRDLTIENGSAASGGGILNNGTLTLVSTTLAKNTASASGGAVENDGTLTVIDSTIAGNAAGASGGGIDNTSTLTLQSTTIAGNSAASGGGVSGTKGSISASNTIIAANTAANGQSDLGAVLNSLGNNLIGNPSGASGLTAHDLAKLDPKLGPLQNNGGPTPTLALLPGSPAIDAGTNTSTLTNDQRGLPRIVNGAIDIGAFELQNSAPTADAGDPYTIRVGDSLTLNASDSTDPNGDALTYSWDINGDGIFGDAHGATPTLTWAQLAAIGIQARLTPYVVRVLVSDGYGPTHQVISDPVALTVLPHLQVTALATTTSGSHAPVNSVSVSFAQAINASSFTKGSLILTRNGGANLITKSVSVIPVAGASAAYLIEGLAALTKPDGEYTLSLNLNGLTDSYGPGLGSSSITWTKDTTAPVSRVLPLPAKESTLSFAVTVSATDPGPAASGVAYDDIYVSDNGGRSRLWTTVPASAPTAVFTGKSGHAY